MAKIPISEEILIWLKASSELLEKLEGSAPYCQGQLDNRYKDIVDLNEFTLPHKPN